jgi:hypothetical protein
MKHVIDVDMMAEMSKHRMVLHVRVRRTWRVILALRWLTLAARLAVVIGGVRLEVDDGPSD